MSGDSRDCQFTGIDRSDCSRVQQTVWKIRESQLDVAILARGFIQPARQAGDPEPYFSFDVS